MYNRILRISLLLCLQVAMDDALAEKRSGHDRLDELYASEPVAGTVWTEAVTGMEFVWVPSGCFQMGGDKYKDEQPVHNVCVKGFWMGRYEVTQAQYRQVMGDSSSKFPGSSNPVENVTWDDATDFSEEMSYITGAKVRLPSEAEWEYACRAGGAHKEYCGRGARPEQTAWYKGNSKGAIHAVGRLEPNKWGLSDMSGNAEEWTQDCEHGDYKGAPTDGSAWMVGDYEHDDYKGASTESGARVAGNCDWHMIRGGSWNDRSIRSLRATSRSIGFAHNKEISSGGFRVARTRVELRLKLSTVLH